ncbi:MAG: histidinol-phosphate aminotransferase family protein, partial [Thermodesulfovibrio sp.]|nr:histidinol-phosphate aminotransferase family protein [Thermodesulfovibrio sp.]
MRHGGCIYQFNKESIIDFSSNINPIRYDINIDFKDAYIYPDLEYRELKEAVAEYLGCKKENVVLGNGAVEIIDAFICAFKRIVVCIPCFSEYIERAVIREKDILKIPLDKNFNVDVNRFKDLKRGDLLILGNPNNPTGLRIPKDILLEIYEICTKRDVFLLLDEAFYEFSCDYDSIELLKDKSNVAIIRAATKFFSLPGIRLGYAYVSIDIKEKIDKLLLPWNVNSFANALAFKFLRDREYLRVSKEYIEKERRYMLMELQSIENIVAYNTHSNFILIKLLK